MDRPKAAVAPDLLKARAYEQILVDIVMGDLAAGAQVDERALARRYGVGLAGVRDALARLALEGLVVRRPRVGTAVAPLDLREIEAAFEVRSLLEGRSAALAARNATPADAAAIAAAFHGAEGAVATGDLRALVAMDRAFHRAVAQASHNPLLARYLMTLQNIAARYWVYAMERQPPEDQLADIALHRDLARAIAAADEPAAEAAMARLIGDPPSLTPGARLRDGAGRALV
ncbi:MAG: GntR family transcriptional regulator [Caulobacteraceae bacterium]|nr:GntR family transcriptional regulator [Caulobacter sp.]